MPRAKTCASKYCNRELESQRAGAKFIIWAPYCSRYCRLMAERGIKPTPKEARCGNCGEIGHNRRTCGRPSKTNKRGKYNYRAHTHQPHYPFITADCDSCGGEVHLRYEDVRKGSQTFCSRQCYWDSTTKKLAGKNSYRDYHMLKNLREYLGGGQVMHAQEIAAMLQNGQKVQVSSTSIGLLMKRWRAQGIVEMVDEGLYKYIGQGPLGALIRAANHAQLPND